VSRWRRQLARRHNRRRAEREWTLLTLHKCHCACCANCIDVRQTFCATCIEAGCSRWPQNGTELAAALGLDRPVYCSVIMPCAAHPPQITNLRVLQRRLSPADVAKVWRDGIDSLPEDDHDN
jgi:hypothetical protein